MDFVLSDEEVALGDSVRSLCESRYPIDKLTLDASAAEPPRLDREGWATLAQAGVFSLEVPERAGGVGLGTGPSAVVFEELGRALVPGPLVSTHLAARDIHELSAGASAGELVVGALHRPSDSTPDALCPVLVPHLSDLDALVVVDPERLAVVETSELVGARELNRPLDPLTPLWRLEDLPAGDTVGDARAASRWRRDESVLTGAMLVGIASKCVEMAVDYAKEREQFGRPIGSFQAVKHICADMLVRSEVARVAVQAAAVTVDQPDVGDDERAAAGSALLATEAAEQNARSCIQVHGGMGFTWEVPAHLFLVRARLLAQFLGPARELAELVAERY
ncbi:MAG: acyl-CoA dehydrogenase family protein [Acidimicrobiales bacterium]